MGTVYCVCGKFFGDAEIPSPYLFTLIPDVAIERLAESLDSAYKSAQDKEAAIPFLIATHGVTVYMCPHCSRLLVLWNGLDRPAASYHLDGTPRE